MKIYRIQDSEGRGPWRPGFSRVWSDRIQHGERPLPWYAEMPDVISKLNSDQNHCFATGCKSLDQLKKWFSEDEYNRLILLGYYAVEIKVDRVYGESENQLVFGRLRPLREGATRVKLYGQK